ncbi:hypothetical protein [Pseudomonas putida]|uniref:Uncharacterized protein n=1 Tax=Pseudomonas putida TaxID=303 RepID=A0A7V8EGA6_PSEPU|nr:hypothetical protein [Pseudomonas putida]KAF0254308.1 hypothetical protein GN299_13710 [Pseudomonas putida]
MLYMLSCLVAMAVATYHSTTTLFGQLAHISDDSKPKPSMAVAMLTMAMALCFMAPLLSLFLSIVKADAAQTVEGVRGSVYLLLVGSLLVVAYAYLLFRRTPQDVRGQFWSVGRLLLLVGVAIVGGVSACKHLTFFHSSKDGVANVGFMRELAQINDMPNCQRGVAFVQYREDEGPLTYRCPTTIMFGGLTSQPFAPWPDFEDGESHDLAAAIKDISSKAQKPDAS